ncbi:unnamed protein product [Calicophoron daubneyi]|uniref:Uncharacterized protein n=1 Tax=Calicophoron daubneyi TaxID=300641 RepID=A0AAV2TSC3_CALDB
MRQLIEDTYTLGGSQRVVLLAHSMGTLYSLQFLDSVSDKWKQKYIEAYVAVGGPFGGAVKSLKGVVSGDNFDTFVGDPLDFRVLERSMPSVLLMLPSPKLWSPDEVVVETPENTYTVHDYERLFRDIGYKHGYKMWQGTRKNTDFMKGPTGVRKVICIHSSSLSTIGKLSYNQKSEGDRGFPDEIPEQTFEDGDGTVNIRSLEVCKQWKDVQSGVRLIENGPATDGRPQNARVGKSVDLTAASTILVKCLNRNDDCSQCEIDYLSKSYSVIKSISIISEFYSHQSQLAILHSISRRSTVTMKFFQVYILFWCILMNGMIAAAPVVFWNPDVFEEVYSSPTFYENGYLNYIPAYGTMNPILYDTAYQRIPTEFRSPFQGTVTYENERVPRLTAPVYKSQSESLPVDLTEEYEEVPLSNQDLQPKVEEVDKSKTLRNPWEDSRQNSNRLDEVESILHPKPKS